VWFIINIEEWNPREPMPRTVLTPPAGGSPDPDIPNWAWHEYGNRVGFWRMLEGIDRFKMPVVLAVDGGGIHAYEPVAPADQAVGLKTTTRPLVSIPYTQECNDVAMILIQHHTASEYRDRAINQFEQLYSDSQESTRIMALVGHPYIMAAPHRFRYFREALEHIHSKPGVLFWTGEQILDWYVEQRPVIRGQTPNF